MNNRADQNDLLAEVLAEASPADFRAALLAETLRLAWRRRQFRRARQAAGVLALAGLLAVLAVQQFSKPAVVCPPSAKNIVKQSYELVRTQPLPASAVIRTRYFPVIEPAASVPKVLEVATVSDGFRLINDNELLALLADKPAVLIRTGPNSEELVFANPEDQKGFLLH
jgi:hypothetical protein